MPARPPSFALRSQLRKKILKRIAELKLIDIQAAGELGFSPGQMSRLKSNQDVFTLDRLVDAAQNLGITVRMSAVRPYGEEQ